MVKIKRSTIKEFECQIEKKKVICFGAGQEFQKLCKQYKLAEKLLYVVDSFNYGKNAQIGAVSVPIISFADMKEEVKESILVLSTIKYAQEILEQLDEIRLLDDVCIYIPKLFSIDIDAVDYASSRQEVIPRVIHYCWFGKNEMPERFRDNIETWKRFCPDYEIKRWDESNYDITKNKYMHQAYEVKKWGFVPDYARLDIIYNYGGIYLDTDVEIIKPLDYLLQFDLFCGFESIDYVALGLGFGAKGKHDVIKKMMDVYENLEFITSKGSYNLTPSPQYQTMVLEAAGLKKNGCTQMIQNNIILSPEYLAPINLYGIGNPTEKTFSIHQYAATWLDEKQKQEKERITNNYRYLIRRMKERL